MVRRRREVKMVYRALAMAEEKFPREEVEKLKLAARLEETLPDTDACPACAASRAASRDPTDLCKAHLTRIYGL